jgi:hypothetical protein
MPTTTAIASVSISVFAALVSLLSVCDNSRRARFVSPWQQVDATPSPSSSARAGQQAGDMMDACRLVYYQLTPAQRTIFDGEVLDNLKAGMTPRDSFDAALVQAHLRLIMNPASSGGQIDARRVSVEEARAAIRRIESAS